MNTIGQIFMFINVLFVGAVGCFAFDYLQGTPVRQFNILAFATIAIIGFVFAFKIV